jgi:hypothetical protein
MKIRLRVTAVHHRDMVERRRGMGLLRAIRMTMVSIRTRAVGTGRNSEMTTWTVIRGIAAGTTSRRKVRLDDRQRLKG